MGALSWGLDLANFEGVPVRLRGFEMQNISMLWSAFIAQIVRQIRVRLIKSFEGTPPFNTPAKDLESWLSFQADCLLEKGQHLLE